MNRKKKKLLEAAGWRVGSTDDFLSLTEEEAAYIDLKITLQKSAQSVASFDPNTTGRMPQIQSISGCQNRSGRSLCFCRSKIRSLFALGVKIRTCQNARIAIDVDSLRHMLRKLSARGRR